jgi:hypothetical protein
MPLAVCPIITTTVWPSIITAVCFSIIIAVLCSESLQKVKKKKKKMPASWKQNQGEVTELSTQLTNKINMRKMRPPEQLAIYL